VGICPKGCSVRCVGSFISLNDRRRTLYRWPTSSSAQRTRMSRASPLPRSGDCANAVMVGVIEVLPTVYESYIARKSANELAIGVARLSTESGSRHDLTFELICRA